MKIVNLLGITIISMAILLQGCSTTSNTSTIKPQTSTKVSEEPALRAYGEKLVEDLTATIPPTAFIDKIAIATMVDVDSLERTDWLGRELAEIFVSSLHNKGFTVVDYKLTGFLEVTKNGDYVYSRNWQKLATKAKVSRVLTGTMSFSERGVMLYGRIVNLKTSMVEASAEVFIPKEHLPECYRSYTNTCNLYGIIDYSKHPKKITKEGRAKQISKADLVGNSENNAKAKKNIKVLKPAGKVEKSANSNVLTKNTTENSEKVLTKVSDNNAPCARTYGENNPPCQFPGASKTNCHKPCSIPLIYPATTFSMGDKLVRDIGTQSQYDRY